MAVLTALDFGNGQAVVGVPDGAGMHAPVSTFEHKGKQYVLAYSAGAALLGSARGDSVWLFGLEEMGPVQAGTPVSRTAAAGTCTRQPSGPVLSDRANTARPILSTGKRIFHDQLRCVSWRRRQGRTHGRRAARQAERSRCGHCDRHQRPQQHAVVPKAFHAGSKSATSVSMSSKTSLRESRTSLKGIDMKNATFADCPVHLLPDGLGGR
jgi:hypothetical protein